MSKLHELIATLCPNGINYKPVGECIVSLKTGLNPRQNFKLNTPDSNIPYITGKDVYNDTINVSERTDKINSEALKLINRRACLDCPNLCVQYKKDPYGRKIKF